MINLTLSKRSKFILLVTTFSFIFLSLWAGPVSDYGALYVDGNKIKSSITNQPVELRGLSSHGLQWFPFHEATVDNLVSCFGVDLVRAAMYVKEWDAEKNYWAGYLGVHANLLSQVRMVIEKAIDNDIYVIVDWHLHWNPDRTSEPFTDEAKLFFFDLANTYYNGKAYKDYPNIIWEVMNEPGSSISWQQVKTHANAVIQEIRGTAGDPDNIILVPPKNWAQDLDEVANDNSSDRPDKLYSNIAYTFHFYANTHGSWLRTKAETALMANLAIFVTEWGTGDSDGNGTANESSSQEWVTWMDLHDISWTNWSFCNKDETTAALVSFSSDNMSNETDWAINRDNRQSGPWEDDVITEPGKWIRSWIGNSADGGSENPPLVDGSEPGFSAENPIEIPTACTSVEVNLSSGYAWVRFNSVPQAWDVNNTGSHFYVRAENESGTASEISSNVWYHQMRTSGIKDQQLVKIVKLMGSDSVVVKYW